MTNVFTSWRTEKHGMLDALRACGERRVVLCRTKLLHADLSSGKEVAASERTRSAWEGGTTYQRFGAPQWRYDAP